MGGKLDRCANFVLQNTQYAYETHAGIEMFGFRIDSTKRQFFFQEIPCLGDNRLCSVDCADSLSVDLCSCNGNFVIALSHDTATAKMVAEAERSTHDHDNISGFRMGLF